MQEVERSYTEIMCKTDSTLIGYFQLAASMADNCFTSTKYYTYMERYYSYRKLLIRAERDDDD